MDTQAPAINIKDQMHRARIHRFLFLPSQEIHKPIQHLKYHRTFCSVDFPNYNFPIPPRAKRSLIKKKKKKKVSSNSSTPLIRPIEHIPQEPSEEITYTHDLPAITIQPIPSDDRNTWHDKLGFLVPNYLLPYVTEDPIYTSKTQEKIKGRTHTPGSQPWFAAIKNRKLLAKSRRKTEGTFFACTTLGHFFIHFRTSWKHGIRSYLFSKPCS